MDAHYVDNNATLSRVSTQCVHNNATLSVSTHDAHNNANTQYVYNATLSVRAHYVHNTNAQYVHKNAT